MHYLPRSVLATDARTITLRNRLMLFVRKLTTVTVAAAFM